MVVKTYEADTPTGAYMLPGRIAANLLATSPIKVGEWQAIDVSASDMHDTYELQDVTVRIDEKVSLSDWVQVPGVNQPWAEEHFSERVGGVPLNPAPSHERWPWSRHNRQHQSGEQHQFSHTYPERIWPKKANGGQQHGGPRNGQVPMLGIRFPYGDLMDVVDMLRRSPYTRQAFLPIWFPEDTGAAQRQRVPCTLGYHFMIRDGALSCRYYMRSCDLIRHFSDDVYLALLLQEHMVSHVAGAITDYELRRGDLVMHVASMHAFRGDQDKLIQIRHYYDE